MSDEKTAQASSSGEREGYAWKENLGPSIVVLLISIPLSMGIAIASGVPPARGLMTAIVGGLVIATLSGTSLQVSGPSAGLAVMVLEIVNKYGLEALAIVVPIMGVIQAGAGVMKLGQLFRAVSPAVINGMLAGIGVLIFSAQFHVAVDDTVKGGGLENLLSIPEAIYKGALTFDGSAHNHAAIIGVLTLGILVGMAALKKAGVGKTALGKIPSALVAVGVATLATFLFDLPIRHVSMPDSFADALVFPSLDSVSSMLSPALVLSAVTLAFVASAETLLCATAVDAMHNGPRTNYDKELVAQGVGNVVCGVIGGIPTTGVITRSTANVEAGATTRASAIMVGAWLLVLMIAFPTAFSVIPRASLAALLVYIGYKLVRYRPYAELKAHGRSELFIFLVTVMTIVAVNLLTGIITGLALAGIKLALSGGKQFHRFQIERVDEGEVTHMHLRGAASFIRLPRLAAALERVPLDREVHLHIDELSYVDHACLDLIDKWECGRISARASVRVEWQTLRHRYHEKNRLDPNPPEHAETTETGAKLLSFISKENVVLGADFSSKWDAIEKLSKRLAQPLEASGADLVATVKERENDASTYLGHGLMLPHGTLPEGENMAGILALSREGWDFPTSDGARVHCIVLLATPPKEASKHLAVLAAFARIFHDEATGLRDALIESSTREAALSVLAGADADSVNYPFESRTSDVSGA